MPIFARLLILLVLSVALNASSGRAQQPAPSGLKLPAVISDHMVLQNGTQDPVWGWASSGTAIRIEFLDAQNKTLASAQAVADASGKWMAKLPPLAPNTAGELHITAGTEPPAIVHDVLVGETWLCGGQSNMVYGNVAMKDTHPDWYAEALKKGIEANGALRVFKVNICSSQTPADDVPGRWVLLNCEPPIGDVSAVAFSFAVALRDKLHCPVGVMLAAVNGTPAEVWIPKADLDSCSVGPQVEKRYQDLADQYPVQIKQYEAADAAWLAANPTPDLQAQNKNKRPGRPGPPFFVSEFYNGMIHGMEPYAVKGVTWFQADGNLGDVPEYGELIKTLIKSWRRCWGAELPFYYVEMNNMRDYPQKDPVQYNDLCVLREQQEAALELPGTDVVCSIDLGLLEPEPHFPNKKPVGQRLALLAFNNAYGLPCPAHSPQYASFAVEGSKVRTRFKYADGLRVRGGGKMIGFAIRGATGDWVWADGRIEGHDILLWNATVPQPVAVRYAWAANPLISVENGAGLPLRPFRTDKTSPQ
jgi:sialate O-acetylesterase